jgi:hypothetical protein
LASLSEVLVLVLELVSAFAELVCEAELLVVVGAVWALCSLPPPHAIRLKTMMRLKINASLVCS